MYKILKYKFSSIKDKIHLLSQGLWPLISVRKMISGVIFFEYIGILDSYFIHRYVIIKYRSSLTKDTIYRLLSGLWSLT